MHWVTSTHFALLYCICKICYSWQKQFQGYWLCKHRDIVLKKSSVFQMECLLLLCKFVSIFYTHVVIISVQNITWDNGMNFSGTFGKLWTLNGFKHAGILQSVTRPLPLTVVFGRVIISVAKEINHVFLLITSTKMLHFLFQACQKPVV